MAIALIEEWLKLPSPGYEQGLHLYERYGSSSSLLTLFRSGKSAFHFRKLSQALQELNQHTEPAPKPSSHIPDLSEFRTQKTSSKVAPDFKALPGIIQSTVADKNNLYARARHLHMKLRTAVDPEQRLTIALAILKDMDEVNDRWKAIDNYISTGEILVKVSHDLAKEISGLPIAEVAKRRSNVPTYISKLKKRIDGMKEPQKSKSIALLQEKYQELELLKRRLNEPV